MNKQGVITFTDAMPAEDKLEIMTAVEQIVMLFEDENVYLEKLYMDENRTTPFQFIDEGVHGTVFFYKDYVLKIVTNQGVDYEQQEVDEVHVFMELEGLPGIPKLYGYGSDIILMERVSQTPLSIGLTRDNQHEVYQQLWEIVAGFVGKGYCPNDVEYVVSEEGVVHAIDFGYLTPLGNQYTVEYIMSKDIDPIFRKRTEGV